jgi:serine/threonine protein kinase
VQLGWAAIWALRVVHNCGILHGDIRASNIMVCSDSMRLLDFGFSRSISKGSYSDDAADKVRQLQKLLGWSTNECHRRLLNP